MITTGPDQPDWQTDRERESSKSSSARATHTGRDTTCPPSKRRPSTASRDPLLTKRQANQGGPSDEFKPLR